MLFNPTSEGLVRLWKEQVIAYIPYPIPKYDKEQNND